MTRAAALATLIAAALLLVACESGGGGRRSRRAFPTLCRRLHSLTLPHLKMASLLIGATPVSRPLQLDFWEAPWGPDGKPDDDHPFAV